MQEGTQSGTFTFTDDGTEQDALAEYLAADYADAGSAFDIADTAATEDTRIIKHRYAVKMTFRGESTDSPLLDELICCERLSYFHRQTQAGHRQIHRYLSEMSYWAKGRTLAQIQTQIDSVYVFWGLSEQ